MGRLRRLGAPLRASREQGHRLHDTPIYIRTRIGSVRSTQLGRRRSILLLTREPQWPIRDSRPIIPRPGSDPLSPADESEVIRRRCLDAHLPEANPEHLGQPPRIVGHTRRPAAAAARRSSGRRCRRVPGTVQRQRRHPSRSRLLPPANARRRSGSACRCRRAPPRRASRRNACIATSASE